MSKKIPSEIRLLEYIKVWDPIKGNLECLRNFMTWLILQMIADSSGAGTGGAGGATGPPNILQIS